MFLGQWLKNSKKESFKLKIQLFRLLISWMQKFQCDIAIFAFLTIDLMTLVIIFLIKFIKWFFFLNKKKQMVKPHDCVQMLMCSFI